MTLTPAFLDELRARTTLSTLVGRSTKLVRAGREWKACCPFHNEKSPSFYVNDDKGFYHCFGCSAHGDAIRWLTEQQGLPFIDAVKELAAAAGLDMPEQDPRGAERAERAKSLHECVADAAAWFAEQLHGLAGAEARELLKRRGITPDTARAFGLGYAPDSRGKLRDALKSYGDAMLVEAGLLIQVDDKEPYDRFRGRLIIPIRDARGRPIAFGGRIIGDGEPKYLNSPETPLFDKGRTLFNLDRAQAAARKAGRVIVVEGYLDVIALAQAGFGEALAPLGTALTEPQLERLWRLCDKPILCFDGDQAGQKAAVRAMHRALPLLTAQNSLAFAMLPSGVDPDDVIRSSGSRSYEGILSRALPLDEFIWRSELAGIERDPGPDERAALLHRLHDAAAKIGDRLKSTQYKQELSNRFYDLFGSKARRFSVVKAVVANSLNRPRANLTYAFHRAILLGLLRYPKVLYSRYEEVDALPVSHRDLLSWKRRMVELAFLPQLSTEEISTQIFEDNDLAIGNRNYQTDLAFSFYYDHWPELEAIEDLQKVIETINEEHEARRAYNMAHADFKSNMEAATYEQQQRTRAASMDARRRLADWLIRLRDAA